MKLSLSVVIDTREQAPFHFDRFPDVAEVTVGTLKTGDYSLAGLEDRVAVERKSLCDLLGSITSGRDRFEREMARAAEGLEYFALVVEGSWSALSAGEYRSRMTPEAAQQTLISWSVRYGVHLFLPADRERAEYFTHAVLRQYARNRVKDEKAA